jgi:hypothetical protein
VTQASEHTFFDATLLDRAALLLTSNFGKPLQAESRLNAAIAIASSLSPQSGIISGGVVSGGRESRIRALRSVAEAWQVLERAGLVCRDLDQSQGDWWLLTESGEAARMSDDVPAAISRALVTGS